MSSQLDDAELQGKMEEAIHDLENGYSRLADDRDIDVEVNGSVLKITFEEGEPGVFVISPNSAARQVWVSARVSSFKFDWSAEANAFVLTGTSETLNEVMIRLTREQLGDASLVL